MRFIEPGYLLLDEAFKTQLNSYVESDAFAKISEDYKSVSFESFYDEIKAKFLDALLSGALTAFVVLPEENENLTVPKEYWDRSFADLTLVNGELFSIEVPHEYKHLGEKPVVLKQDEWEAWIDGGEPKNEPSKPRRGRPTKYDWDAFFAEIAVRADLDSLPETQADLVRDMAVNGGVKTGHVAAQNCTTCVG